MTIAVMTTIVGTAFAGSATRERVTGDSGAAVGQAAGSSTAEDIRDLERAAPDSTRCPSARRGLRFYRVRYGHWVTMRGATPSGRGRTPRNCADARWLADVWRARARDQRATYERWHHHHHAWESWLPSNWRSLAVCETSLNWEHSNSSFTSAFGISWREYNADAAYMGAPPWHVRHTPRDQYNAARGHLARFGDGWTCPGP